MYAVTVAQISMLGKTIYLYISTYNTKYLMLQMFL